MTTAFTTETKPEKNVIVFFKSQKINIPPILKLYTEKKKNSKNKGKINMFSKINLREFLTSRTALNVVFKQKDNDLRKKSEDKARHKEKQKRVKDK